jgi:hypothetical protein
MIQFRTRRGFYLPHLAANTLSIEIATLRARHGRIGALVETRI